MAERPGNFEMIQRCQRTYAAKHVFWLTAVVAEPTSEYILEKKHTLEYTSWKITIPVLSHPSWLRHGSHTTQDSGSSCKACSPSNTVEIKTKLAKMITVHDAILALSRTRRPHLPGIHL